MRLRRAVRAIVLAEDDHVLLCCFRFPHPAVPTRETVVWAAPGGGIEPGEMPLAALRRELHEETGLAMDTDPLHVWHQVIVGTGQADGYDGVGTDYFLVRTARFDPRGALSEPTSWPSTGRPNVIGGDVAVWVRRARGGRHRRPSTRARTRPRVGLAHPRAPPLAIPLGRCPSIARLANPDQVARWVGLHTTPFPPHLQRETL